MEQILWLCPFERPMSDSKVLEASAVAGPYFIQCKVLELEFCRTLGSACSSTELVAQLPSIINVRVLVDRVD